MNPTPSEFPPLVRLRKLRPAQTPDIPTTNWSEWKPGAKNPLSLPTGYELVGLLITSITVDKPFCILRLERNGGATPGHYWSTPARRIHGNLIETRNSIYEITPAELTRQRVRTMQALLNAIRRKLGDSE